MLSRNVLIGLVSSVVVLALAVGLWLTVESVVGSDLELPDEVGGLPAADSSAAYPDDEQLARLRAARERDAEGWSEAFDGADAVTRTYVGDAVGDVALSVSVTAVAADAGPLVPPDGFVDAAELGLALPPVERVVEGDVECLLFRNQPPRVGTDYQPDQAAPDAHTCQRRSGALTVRVRAATADTDAVLELVEEVWDRLR